MISCVAVWTLHFLSRIMGTAQKSEIKYMHIFSWHSIAVLFHNHTNIGNILEIVYDSKYKLSVIIRNTIARQDQQLVDFFV